MAVQAEKGRRKQNLQGLNNVIKWKQKATEMLINNETICKLLYYPTPDWANKPNLTQEQKDELLQNNIKQYRYIDGIATKKTSVISLGTLQYSTLEEFRLFSNDFLQGFIIFYILCDVDIMETNQGIRADLLQQEIYNTFQAERGFGLGELILKEQQELWVDYNRAGGYTIGFKVVDIK